MSVFGPIFISLTLLRVIYSFDLIAKKQAVSYNETVEISILSSFEVPSLVTCIASCRQQGLEICLGVHVIPVDNCGQDKCPIRCHIISDSTNKNAVLMPVTSAVYQWANCSYASDPCQQNICYNGGKCLAIYEAPQCYATSFQCLCDNHNDGQFCEKCASNFIGPNCSIDISDSILLDGIYFYIPFGIYVNGTDTDMAIRPICTESRRLCQLRGMQLLTIKTAEKNATVSKLLLHKPECVLCFYQLNLQRNDTDEHSVWWWGNDPHDVLKSSDFSGWYYGQPDDAIGETYAAFKPYIGYSWADISCTFPAYYICEYDTNQMH